VGNSLTTVTIVINQNQKMSDSDFYKHSCWIYEKRLPNNICDLLIEEFKNQKFEYGSIIQNYEVLPEKRNVKTVPISLDHWCNGIAMYYGFDANFANFKYNISEFESLQFLSYEEGMFYVVHNDVSPYVKDISHRRKLTVIIQLSDKNDYTGGDVILYDSGLNPEIMSREKGTIIVFNSAITHCVSKVITGTRYSLCGWLLGPPFS